MGATIQYRYPRDTMMKRRQNLIPDRSDPGLTRTAPFIDQDEGEKSTTGQKLNIRNNFYVGTWNVRTLNQKGKLAELTHGLMKYKWNVLGLCETRWKDSGEITTEDHHKFYYSGKLDKHEHGVGFLVNSDTTKAVLGCRPISSRLISIRLRASPFNITIIQSYAPTSDYDDDDVEDFYEQLQEVIDQTPKKDILIVQGDWNAKVGSEAKKDWGNMVGLSANETSNDRGLRLLEFAKYNSLVLANTLGTHKRSRISTWHAPDGEHHNQIDYIHAQNRFKSSINIQKTRTFPGADIGSDHDLVLMNLKLRLKKLRKQEQTRIRFDLDKLNDPNIHESFQAKIGGKFAPLIINFENETDINKITSTMNTIITETAEEVLGKKKSTKKPWVTDELLSLCDKRKELKNKKSKRDEYKQINNNIKTGMVKAHENPDVLKWQPRGS